jgi:hypothetical protein
MGSVTVVTNEVVPRYSGEVRLLIVVITDAVAN